MTQIRCPLCEGTRWDPNTTDLVKCPRCRGGGFVERPRWSGPSDARARPGGGGRLVGFGLVPAGLHRALRRIVPLLVLPLWLVWAAPIIALIHMTGLTFLGLVAPFVIFVLGMATTIHIAARFDRLARCPGCGGRCIVEVVPGAPTRPPSEGDRPETLRQYRCLRCGSTREIGYEPPISPWRW